MESWETRSAFVEEERLSGWLFICSSSKAASFVPRIVLNAESEFPWMCLEDKDKLDCFVKAFALRTPVTMQDYLRYEIDIETGSANIWFRENT